MNQSLTDFSSRKINNKFLSLPPHLMIFSVPIYSHSGGGGGGGGSSSRIFDTLKIIRAVLFGFSSPKEIYKGLTRAK